MEVLARKPGRVLWTSTDPEGRTRYEWRATTAEGVAIEPASCSYTSRHQANLAWAADNQPAPPGRPRTASEANRKAGGNPPLLLRLTPELHEAAQARGGASWVRSLIEKELKEDVMTLEKFASNAEFPAISWESDCPEEFDLLGTFPDSWGLPFPVDLMGSVDGRGKWQWDGCGSLSDRQGFPIRRITVYERD